MFRKIRKQTVRVIKSYSSAGLREYCVHGPDEFLGFISIYTKRFPQGLKTIFEVESKEGIKGEAVDFSDALNLVVLLNEEGEELVPDPITGLIF